MNNSQFEPEAFEFDFEDRRSGRIRPSFSSRPSAGARTQSSGRTSSSSRTQFGGRSTQSARAWSQGRSQRGASSDTGQKSSRQQGTSSQQSSRFRNWPQLRPFMQTIMTSSASTGGADSDMIRMIQSQLSALGFR